MPTTPQALRPVLGPDATLGEPWPRSPLRQCSLWLAKSSVRTLSLAAHALDRLGNAAGVVLCDANASDDLLAGWVASSQWPAKPLRVAVTTRAAWARRLPEADGCFNVEWVQVGTLERHLDLLGKRGFDAVVGTSADGSPEVILRESPGRDAAWFDWGTPRPLSYPALFSPRLDCARISCPGEPRTEDQTRLFRALIEAACVLARSEARTDLTDRLAGRVPADRRRDGDVARDRAAWNAMWRLAEVLDASSGSGDHSISSLNAAAGRIVGSWAATADDRLEDDRRRRFAEAAARNAPSEAESWFRLAAVRFATLDDIGGFEALTHARDLIRASSNPAINADQQIFVIAELSADDGQCTTLGRVAAGVGLLLATLPNDKIRYIADDLRDDLRYSGLLVGRDQDHRLMLEVVNLFSPPVLSFVAPQPETAQPGAQATAPRADAAPLAQAQSTQEPAQPEPVGVTKPKRQRTRAKSRTKSSSKPRTAAPAPKPRRKAA